MPSSSHGPTAFTQVLPGSPSPSLQSFTTFTFRFKRYVAYISGSQLNVLSSPTNLNHAISFDHQLLAVEADGKTGKLAVAGKSHVWVLEPVAEGWDKVWWDKTLYLVRPDAEDEALCVSWGNEGEVLVGGSKALSLFSTLASSRTASPVGIVDETAEQRAPLWSKAVASPICQAAFSPSSSIIATCARYDRLVKIWRRLSFEEGLFDHTYLPHGGTVTHFQWRPLNANAEERRGSGISGRHDDGPEVLYTIATDAVLRVWRTGGSHDLDILVLHTTIDLVAAIPNSPTLTSRGFDDDRPKPARYAVMIPSDDFTTAVNAAIGVPQQGKVNHSKELLKEMISHEADVVVTFDGQGRMSAWGLESIGHRRRSETPITPQAFHIAHSEQLQMTLPGGSPATCGTWFQDDEIHLLTHSLVSNGEITWWKGKVEDFFSSSASGHDRLSPGGVWSGHNNAIADVRSSPTGIISWSSGDISMWNEDRDLPLRWEQSVTTTSDVRTVAVLTSKGLLLVVTASEFLAHAPSGELVAKTACTMERKGRVHVSVSTDDRSEGVFVQDNGQQVIRWKIVSQDAHSLLNAAISIDTISTSGRHGWSDVLFAVPVSSVRELNSTCIAIIGKSGRIVVDKLSSEGQLVSLATFETGIEGPSLFAASTEFAAIVSNSANTLTIVHLNDGYIEHNQVLNRDVIGLEAFSSDSGQNYLAVGYGTTIDVLVQGRYEHSSSEVPTWISVKTISIEGTGLDVSDMAWRPNGSLAAAAGNGVFIASSEIEISNLSIGIQEAHDLDQSLAKNSSLAHVATQMQSALPAWHPSLLSRLVQHGHLGVVASILEKLSQKLKFWGPDEELDSTLDEPLTRHMRETSRQHQVLGEDTVSDLKEQLDSKDLPALSTVEQRRLGHVIDAVADMNQHVGTLDKNALRYLFNWKLQLLYNQEDARNGSADAGQTNGAVQSQFVPNMPWREVAFAYHSTTQQALLDILLLHLDNKITWPAARRLGITAWLSDRAALEQIFEQIAQSAYRSEQPPDPVNASIYFLALHKKATLIALWRIATWHREQKSTMNFLKKDFAQPEARTAARKNAYALMGKRRFHYSAAFFLLADDASSAVSIIAGQCEDPAFAVAVARLYCGDGSSVLRTLLEDRIMPQAKKDGNRWLLSWCHEVLLERDQAAESLIMPLDGPKTWQQDDPNTVLLYRTLRKVASPYEYSAVLRAARILRRMGQWLLALNLVSTWEFRKEAEQQSSANSVGQAAGIGTAQDDDSASTPQEPPSLLDSFAGPTPPAEINAASSDANDRQAKAAELLKKLRAKKEAAAKPVSEKPKPPPTQFKEPDANSLLDSFGF
ncbi:unnamed protein product [Zymoseptoria tritici ST99CH_3D1]|nr:unnamed protein product [Zymoseptoria tritici ST99CH_3D1]